MTLPMAREFGRIGVRVMTIAPGIFWTPMVGQHAAAGAGIAVGLDPYPSRLGQPHEVRRRRSPSSSATATSTAKPSASTAPCGLAPK
jgi:NAD(P)-dependent dehydrogenase (short-subunit alcohol dehydrogenase family)